jgi:hypothetical protein
MTDMQVQIDNVDRGIQYYLDTYNGLKKKKMLLKIVWLENLDNPDCFLEFEFFIDSAISTDTMVTLNVSTSINVLSLNLPKKKFSNSRCQYYAFKDSQCGYAGDETVCDRTLNRCIQLGNYARFGGFTGVPMNFRGIIKKYV